MHGRVIEHVDADDVDPAYGAVGTLHAKFLAHAPAGRRREGCKLARHARHVVGMDELERIASDPLLGRNAEHPQEISGHRFDLPIRSEHDDEVVGVLGDRTQPLLARFQPLDGVMLCRDVLGEREHTGHAATGVALRAQVRIDDNRGTVAPAERHALEVERFAVDHPFVVLASSLRVRHHVVPASADHLLDRYAQHAGRGIVGVTDGEVRRQNHHRGRELAHGGVDLGVFVHVDESNRGIPGGARNGEAPHHDARNENAAVPVIAEGNGTLRFAARERRLQRLSQLTAERFIAQKERLPAQHCARLEAAEIGERPIAEDDGNVVRCGPHDHETVPAFFECRREQWPCGLVGVLDALRIEQFEGGAHTGAQGFSGIYPQG